MAKSWVGALRTLTKPVPRPIAVARPAAADGPAVVVDVPEVVDARAAGVVDVTTIRAMRDSLESRAGKEQNR